MHSAATLPISTHPALRCAVLCGAGGFLLAFRSCLTYLFFQSSPQAGTAVRLVASIGWLMAVLAYLVLEPPPARIVPRNRVLTWIGVYLATAGVSLLWTTTGSPTVEVGYWVGLLSDVAAVYLLLRYENVDEN